MYKAPVNFMFTKKPLVSVIMPAYNAEKTIEESVQSVIAQTCENWELLIIIDKGDDKTDMISEGYAQKDDRMQVIVNAERLGIAGSRNRGIELAGGDWLAFLDSDDLWTADKLEKQLVFMDNHNAQISYTASAFEDMDGKRSNYIQPAIFNLDFNTFLNRNIMSCSSVMVRRELAHEFMFELGNVREDWLLWLNIVSRVGVSYGLDEPLLIYRQTENSESSDKLKIGIGTFNTYRKVGCNFIISAVRTFQYLLYSMKKRKLING
jgi:teichuronic acid biosynthesis glycosyltransferase TuaG